MSPKRSHTLTTNPQYISVPLKKTTADSLTVEEEHAKPPARGLQVFEGFGWSGHQVFNCQTLELEALHLVALANL